jgi:hypothetical protein
MVFMVGFCDIDCNIFIINLRFLNSCPGFDTYLSANLGEESEKRLAQVAFQSPSIESVNAFGKVAD